MEKNKFKELANIIFPDIDKNVEDYLKIYPKRNLPDDARVTRFAPSPTGFVHIGNFFQALISFLNAKKTNGIFFLRNEDTDQKREKKGAMELVFQILKNYNLKPDEYEIGENKVGIYAPYIQSKRKKIYHAFIKELILKGRAYPAFETSEELSDIRNMQMENKIRIGYYGKFARSRYLTIDEQIEKIKKGEKFVIRFKSLGNADKKIEFKDEIRGKIYFPENDMDAVIMKSDNMLPTYHFAHVVDDFLMQTTHVTRGEEWLSSVPLHIELFEAFGIIPPKYIHNPLIMKKDGDKMRKLSKRKDPETSMKFYEEKGYPKEAVIDSLMIIINSNYEIWRENNPKSNFLEFPFEIEKINASGALYSLEKLNNISKNTISLLDKNELYKRLIAWAKIYDKDFYNIIIKDEEYTKNILNIERENKKPRKDFINLSSIKEFTWFLFDELFYNNINYGLLDNYNKNIIKKVAKEYLKIYKRNIDKEAWFEECKKSALLLGFTTKRKEYKENPENYIGFISDYMNIIRIILTTKDETPDLWEICNCLGENEVEKRINNYLNNF